MRDCPNCGARNASDNAFCTACGSALGPTSPRGRRVGLVTGAVIGALLLVAVGLSLATGDGDDTSVATRDVERPEVVPPAPTTTTQVDLEVDSTWALPPTQDAVAITGTATPAAEVLVSYRGQSTDPAVTGADGRFSIQLTGVPEGESTATVSARKQGLDDAAESITIRRQSFGTEQYPAPMGQPLAVGDWEVTVISTIPDGNAAVRRENQFNAPPPPGGQFFIVKVSVKNVGVEATSAQFRLRFSSIGQSRVAYDYQNSCGVIPERLPSNEVFPGGTVTGNVCWAIMSSDAASLVMQVADGFSSDRKRYFALRR